ncbi:MAG TPA: hypothetical protein QF720_05050 [Nitrospinota bacterium]|nr:hypothetical protein [Nitrospinota bacterium]
MNNISKALILVIILTAIIGFIILVMVNGDKLFHILPKDLLEFMVFIVGSLVYVASVAGIFLFRNKKED